MGKVEKPPNNDVGVSYERTNYQSNSPKFKPRLVWDALKHILVANSYLPLLAGLHTLDPEPWRMEWPYIHINIDNALETQRNIFHVSQSSSYLGYVAANLNLATQLKKKKKKNTRRLASNCSVTETHEDAAVTFPKRALPFAVRFREPRR